MFRPGSTPFAWVRYWPVVLVASAMLPFGAADPAVALGFAGVGASIGGAALVARRPDASGPSWLTPLLLAACWLASACALAPVSASLRAVAQPGYAAQVEASLAEAGLGAAPLALHPRAAAFALAEAAFLLVILCAVALRPARDRRELASGLTVVGAGLAVVALASWALGPGPYGHAAWGSPRADAFGPFVNENHGALALAALAPLAWSRSWSRRQTTRWLSRGVSVGVVVTVALSGSRGAVAAMVVGALVFAWGVVGARARAVLAGGVALVGVAVGVAGPRRVVGVISGWLEPDGARAWAYDDVLSGRSAIWAHATDVVARAPWVGVGPGGFEHAFAVGWRGARFTNVSHAHQELLQLVIEHGAVVAAGVVVAVGVAAARAARHPDAATARGSSLLGWLASAAVLAVGCTVDFPLRIGAVAVLAAVVLGVLVGAKPSARGARWNQAASWGVAALGVAAVALVARVVAAPDHPFFGSADAAFVASEEARRAGDPAAAVAAARVGLGRAPIAARGWFELGSSQLARGDRLAAIGALQRAADQAPGSPWAAVALARLWRDAGEDALATDYWRRALLVPVQDDRWFDAALAEALAGDDPATAAWIVVPPAPDRACRAARALDERGLDAAEHWYAFAAPHIPSCRTAYASFVLRVGRRDEARALLDPPWDCASARVFAASAPSQDDALTDAADAVRRCGPLDRDANLQLADAALAAGDSRRALAIADRLIQHDPDDAGPRHTRAAALWRAGDLEAARRDLQWLRDHRALRPEERAWLDGARGR
jgi:O-antigen ligase